LGYRPGDEHAVDLQSEVEVQAGGVVPLDHEAGLRRAALRSLAAVRRTGAAVRAGSGRFVGARALPLLAVVAELVLGHGGCLLDPTSRPRAGGAPAEGQLVARRQVRATE